MNVLLVLIPVTTLIILMGVAMFFWAVNHRQFDDLESPAVLPLLEEEASSQKPADVSPDDATATPASKLPEQTD